jgi:hypothetical protein
VAADDSETTGFRPSRRELMRAAAGTLGALALAGRTLGQETATRPASQPATSTSAPASQPVPTPWWLTAYPTRSRVVDARSETVINGTEVSHPILVEMLQRAVQVLTDTANPTEAWKRVLGPAERIAIKFNQVGARTIGTTDAFAAALVENLVEAGYAADTITLAEAPAHVSRSLGTRSAEEAWGAPIGIGSETDDLAKYVCDADAIINVPFLKTHQIAGMSGALKNLSHGIIQHPARFHANGCSPYVGQIVGAEMVSSRLKISIVNALRTVVQHGPDARAGDVVTQGGVLVGLDPVSVDTIGRDMLLAQRRKRGIVEGIEVRYLESADELGVGRGRRHGIERIPISHA